MITERQKIRFLESRLSVIGADSYSESGIGTLSEKSLHRILKLYIDPNEEHHEVDFLGSVADVLNEDGIFEIQTRSIERLKPKLSKFLPSSKVTVVLPLAEEKVMRWLDKSTGELSEPRMSPKHETVYSAMRELYKIRRNLLDENIRIKLIFLKTEEYRYLDGWDKTGKKGSTRLERIPTEITDEIDISSSRDYAKYIPTSLPEKFTAKELCRAAKFSPKITSYVVGLLVFTGALEHVENRGREYVYVRTRVK